MGLRRIAAFMIDWCCMLVWIGLVAASCESHVRGQTPGKGALKVRVVHRPGAPARPGSPSFGRALARNALKIGLPWVIAHIAVFAVWNAAGSGSIPVWTSWLLAGAYVVPLLWIISLLLPGTLPIYDRVCGTEVRRNDDGPSPSG